MESAGSKLTFDGLGAAFYPDQQRKEDIPAYVERLAEAGISFVRMAEFAWDKLEPEEGQFDFGWLDDALAMLERKNIRTLLCTPTAVPPVWMSERYGEIHPVLADGKTFGFGSRRYVCVTSPAFRDLSLNMVRAMGRHYAGNRRIIGWQLDNEVGGPFCFCPRCLELFRKFCREQFATIAEFNDRLNTHFWGQSFQNFEQILFPNVYNSPSMWQLYHRFFSRMTIEYFNRQATELRDCGVTAPISTNTMLTWYGYDHREMLKNMDYACGDYYYSATPFGADFATDAFIAAYLRGLKPETNIRYNEFQCSKEHFAGYVPVPGEIRNRTLTHIGLGADHICYFRWDYCLGGAERDAYGILRSPDCPGRGFAEIKELATELKEWESVLDGSRFPTGEVAFLYSYESQYDLTETVIPPDLNGPQGNGYPMFMSRQFRALVENRIMPDIVFADGDFSPYKVIIASALYVITPNLMEKIQDYVRNGGCFLMLPLSGVVDECGKLFPAPAPGPLSEMFGVKVVDCGRYNPIMGAVKFRSVDPGFPVNELTVDRWLDEIVPAPGTRVLAVYSGPFHENIPAMTCRPFGNGAACYLGTWFDRADELRHFYAVLARWFGLTGETPELPEQVYAVRRIKGETILTFMINTAGEERKVVRPGKEDLVLAPFGVRISATESAPLSSAKKIRHRMATVTNW